MGETKADAAGASSSAAPAGADASAAKKETAGLVVADLHAHFAALAAAVNATDLRGVARLVSKTNGLRKRLTAGAAQAVIDAYLKKEPEFANAARAIVAQAAQAEETAMDTADGKADVEMKDAAAGEEEAPKDAPKDAPKAPEVPALPEVAAYAVLLVVQLAVDRAQVDGAARLSTALVAYVQKQTRHTMAAISGQVYFFYSRSHELQGRLEDTRSTLLAAHRTASIRKEAELQATLINLLLRNYLHYNQYDPAEKLIRNSDIQEGAVSANQFARYLYYDGRINAIQLHYRDAHRKALHALRKAPQNTALGFRIACSKLQVVVELLMGQIPDRQLFNQTGFRGPLLAYYKLTQAVRKGDLADFRAVVAAHRAEFLQDNTLTLIQRVHHNVIKTGLRKINVAYSSISIRDVCKKLHLESEADAEFMVAKAIRDDVIEATIVHDQDGAYLKSKSLADVYSTQQPQEAFNERIQFFLNVHNEAVKAMRFPDKKYGADEETEEERLERLKEEQDLAKILEEEDDEFD